METENINNNYKSNIIKFLAGQTISLVGSFLVMYATIWYITLETGSGAMATVSVLVSFLPQVLISLFAGVWADKYNKKNLIMYSDAIIAIATLVLAIIFLCGIRDIWLIFIIAAIRSLASGIQMPAINSFIPCITPEDKLMRVNGLNSMIQSIMMIVSPIVSGALLAFSKVGDVYKLENIFFIDVVTAAIGIYLLYTIKYNHEKKPEEKNENEFKDLKEGLKYIKEHTVIKKLLGYYAVLSFLFTPIAFLSTLLVTRTFGEEVWKLTMHEAVFGVGSVIGGVIIAFWGGFKNRIQTIIVACISFGVLSVCIGFSYTFILYLVFMGITGILIAFFNTPTMVYFQENVELGLQGRIFSFLGIVTSATMPIGMILLGPLADITQIQYIFIGAGILTVIISTIMCFDKAFKSKEVKEEEPQE